MPALVVSVQSLQVLASDGCIFDMLGYHPHDIVGQNILALIGAGSDPQMLKTAILEMQDQKLQLVLYDAFGRERLLIVSCSPCHDNRSNISCLLNLHPSEAIVLQSAISYHTHACAVVSANHPHAIHAANDAFLQRFTCTLSEVLGRPLHLFHRGAHFSYIDFDHAARSTAAWSALLLAALDGRIARMTLLEHTVSGGFADEVTCTPVTEASNGRISHLQIAFRPPPPHRRESPPRPGEHRHPPIVGGAALGLFFFWRLFHRILAPHRPDLEIASA